MRADEERAASRLFIAARLASTLGDNMYTVALVFAAIATGGGARAVAVVLAAEMVPKLALSPIAGVVCDRSAPLRVLVVGDFVAGVMTIGVTALIVFGEAGLPSLVALSVMVGSATAFFDPAALKLLATRFPRDERQRLNADLGIASSISRIAGPAISGVLVAVAGSMLVFLVNGVSFLISGLLFLALARVGGGSEGETSADMGGRTRRGRRIGALVEYFRIGWLWRLGVQTNVVIFCGVAALNTIGPLYANRYLGGATAWGIILACGGAGFFAGRLATRRRHFGRPAYAAAITLFPVALPVLVIGCHGSVAMLALAQFLSGAGLAARGTLWGSLVTMEVDVSVVSSVASVEQMVGLVTVTASLAATGGLVGWLGVRTVSLSAFVGVVLVTAVISLSPTIRSVSWLRSEGGGSS